MKKIIVEIRVLYKEPALSSSEIRNIEEHANELIKKHVEAMELALQRRVWSTIEVILV